jgi:hypothetical protein
MIRNILLATAAIAVLSAPAAAVTRKAPTVGSASATLPASNPFAKPSTLPFQTPDFSKIKDSDYLPALLAGMAQQKREVTAIANQRATPNFDNTVVAMERSGLLLERANLAFSAVNGANTNEKLQATDTKTSPLLAAHNDFIYLNAKLYQRFKYLHDHQGELSLNPRLRAVRRRPAAHRQLRRTGSGPDRSARRTGARPQDDCGAQHIGSLRHQFHEHPGRRIARQRRRGCDHRSDRGQ